MPQVPMSPAEARDIAAFVTTAELSPRAPASAPERLALLSRRVTYAEVDRRVFRVTCRHCHSEPDYALGDGGPGNTGGFGFKPRGLNLATYEGIAAGYVDDQGERRSVFSRGPDGAPRLVAALLARQAEEAAARIRRCAGCRSGCPRSGRRRSSSSRAGSRRGGRNSERAGGGDRQGRSDVVVVPPLLPRRHRGGGRALRGSLPALARARADRAPCGARRSAS